MNNFIQRTLSGFVFVALIVGSIISCQYAFATLFAVVCGWAVYEFHKLTNQQENINPSAVSGMLGGVILFLTSFAHASNLVQKTTFPVYGLFLVIVLISELYRKKANPINNWAYFLMGQVFVALPFSLLNHILFFNNNWQPYLLLAVFATIWVNDTAAYVVGINFGKHRLFERISPKKSWEGFVGGAIAALGSGYVFSLIIPEISLINWLIISEIIVVFGTFGDLIESLTKRTINIKDSGNIIPGHGGLLDRFDSMLLAAPVVFVYLTFLAN